MKKLILLSAFAAAASSVALAHDNDRRFQCSNETLEGVFALSISGTRPAPPPPSGAPSYVPGTIEQLIGVGTRTFNGDGTFQQITNEKGSLSGLLFPNRALQGTYSVNPDCSGTLTLFVPGLPVPIVYDIVVDHSGRKFESIVASPAAVMVTTTGQRLR
jgi:hypothetical protein